MRIDQRDFKEMTMNNEKCPVAGLTQEEMTAVVEGLVKVIRGAGYCIEKQPENCEKTNCCKGNIHTDDTQA